jgi:uncharacterized repeat protein (TIGR02543 family)
LSIKTTFGKPLSFAVNGDGTDGNMGIYFDSLVKFTVCEEAPDTDYDGAKIAMWLQEEYDEDDNIKGTNLMVKAGFLSIEGTEVKASEVVYKAGNTQIKNDGAFADKWHRVTIKTIADITEDGDDVSVPGFVIYIDGNLTEAITIAATDQPKWDESFTYALNEIAENLNDSGYLFPSMVQGLDTKKDALTGVQFDGTGSINELVFTETDPEFAKDEKYMDPKFTYTYKVGDDYKTENFETIDELVAYIADFGAGEYTIALAQNISIDSTITIANENGAEIILDLNGCTIERSTEGYAITVANGTWLTITDSDVNKNGKISSNFANGGAVYVGGDEARLTLLAGIMDGAIECQEVQNKGEENEIAGGVAILQGGKVRFDNIDLDGYKYSDDGYGFFDILPLGYFTVTFVLNNGSDNVVIENVVEDTKASEIKGIPVPEKAGFTFTWSPALDTTTITADTTFEAQWTANTYTITFKIGDTTTTINKEYGSTITADDIEDLSKTGYEIVSDVNPVGQKVEGETTYTYTYTAIEYTISYDVEGVAATTYTVADLNTTIKLATATREGYTFNGWTNETIKTAIKSLEISALADIKFYASWTENTPAEPETPEIAPGSDSVKVDAGAGATAEDVAAKVEVQLPAEVVVETGVDNKTYQGYFTKTATLDESTGTWTVTAKIAEEVEEAVAESAVEALSAAEPTVSIPRGLYYKITTMEDLGDTTSPSEKGISNGNVIRVNKPGTSKGFIKIQIGTQAY